VARFTLLELIAEVQAFLRRLGATEAILFGSRARGEELLNSDVDLVIISPNFAGRTFPERLRLLQEQWTLPLFLEGLPYTPEEIEELRHSRGIVARALEEGIHIHCGCVYGEQIVRALRPEELP